ncbi:MAG: BrnT family toxin [Spirochaetales bacterium]|jgi:uncharacterized DUF497 family protein|nr:BrnT family toxin [Spirochaetales bacterium]
MDIRNVSWDTEKAAINRQIHGLSFEAARLVFSDPNRIERIDRSKGNTSGEERWQTLGMVDKVLFVVYTERGENPRLISARIANNAERRSYHGNYQIDGKGWSKAD